MKTTLVIPMLLTLCSFFLLGSGQPATAKRKVAVKLEHVIEITNKGVGHDWIHYLSINDKKLIKKEEELIIELKKRAPLRIEAHSIEEDKDYSDLGENHMDFTYSDLISIEDNFRFEMVVVTVENGGKNAGNIAKWKFIFTISKVK